MQLAVIEHDAGNNAAAEKLYREVIALEPRFDQAHYELGLLLAEDQKRLPEAAKQLGEATKLAPLNARAFYNYGIALQQLGDTVKAEEALYKAYQLEPTSTEYLYALAILYAQTQDWKNALACAEKLVAMDRQYERFYRQLMQQSQQP